MTSSSSSKSSRGPSTAIRWYLIIFNLVSFFGWVLILTATIKHLAFGPQTPSLPLLWTTKLISPFRSLKILSINPKSHWPDSLRSLHLNAQTLQQFVSPLVAVVQSLALMEVVHAAVGWVRSPVPTTAIQVASRLFLVWGVTERYTQAMTNPWYAGMIIAWSVTECIRYPFYASQLMGGDTSGLLWARYTTFFVLYPLGAASEAMEIFSTLPNKFPRQDLSAWNLRQAIFALLFVIWWPGLYVMYSHMMSQRRRAIGKGLWGDKAIKDRIEKKRLEAPSRKSGVQSTADASWATGVEAKKEISSRK